MKEELVSIVVPVYNAEKFLEDTINTVLNQTYENWELIFVDDCSADNSVNIIRKSMKRDKRIKLICNKVNSKAAISRNKGIEAAKGKYICFLDADDIWSRKKIENQLKFMKSKDCAFSFTNYEFANEKGEPNGKKVTVPPKMNYRHALGNTTIWTCTVMLDVSKLKKDDIYMPNVPSEDTACWWKILKKIDYAYGLNENLSFYRRTSGTLSSNKFVAIKRIWYLYRKVEKINIFMSLYFFVLYAFNAVKRRI